MMALDRISSILLIVQVNVVLCGDGARIIALAASMMANDLEAARQLGVGVTRCTEGLMLAVWPFRLTLVTSCLTSNYCGQGSARVEPAIRRSAGSLAAGVIETDGVR
jgi:hypothetical protein